MSQISSCLEFYQRLHVLYIFDKADAKSSSIVMQKMPHVTSVICHMSHMLHVKNIKLPRILPKTQCVIYFWKADAKSSLTVMQKTTHATCGMCHMSPISSFLDPVC